LVSEGDEEAVVGGGFHDCAAGEGSECREDKGVLAEEEAWQAERGVFAVGDAYDRVPMSREVKFGSGGVGGVVDDAAIFFEIELRDAGDEGTQRFDFCVVVACH